MRLEGVYDQGQGEPSVQRCALLLQRLHVPDGGAAEKNSQLRASPTAIEEGAQHTRQFRGGRDQLGELIEDHEQGGVGRELGQPFEGIVPVGVGPACEVPQLLWGDRSGLASQLQEIAFHRSAGAGVEHRRQAGSELLQQGCLANPPTPPDDRGPRGAGSHHERRAASSRCRLTNCMSSGPSHARGN